MGTGNGWRRALYNGTSLKQGKLSVAQPSPQNDGKGQYCFLSRGIDWA